MEAREETLELMFPLKAAKLVCEQLIKAVKFGVLSSSLDHQDVWEHIKSVEDQEAARKLLTVSL